MLTRNREKRLNSFDDDNLSRKMKEKTVLRDSQQVKVKINRMNSHSVKNPINHQIIDLTNNSGSDVEIKPTKSELNPSKTKSSQHSSSTVVIFSQLKKLIENHYMDIKERLQLTSVPSCLLNLKKCSIIHSKKSENACEISSWQYIPQQMILAERFGSFAKMTNDLCGRDEFPDKLILPLLEVILVSYLYLILNKTHLISILFRPWIHPLFMKANKHFNKQ